MSILSNCSLNLQCKTHTTQPKAWMIDSRKTVDNPPNSHWKHWKNIYLKLDFPERYILCFTFCDDFYWYIIYFDFLLEQYHPVILYWSLEQYCCLQWKSPLHHFGQYLSFLSSLTCDITVCIIRKNLPQLFSRNNFSQTSKYFLGISQAIHFFSTSSNNIQLPTLLKSLNSKCCTAKYR